MEKILHISSEGWQDKNGSWSHGYDGYVITTDKQQIKIGISDGQQCCENWGIITSEDDTSDFIGAELISITTTDTMLNSLELKMKREDLYGEYASTMFVSIATSKGQFQIVLYNVHNGYYGHDVTIKSTQLSHEGTL